MNGLRVLCASATLARTWRTSESAFFATVMAESCFAQPTKLREEPRSDMATGRPTAASAPMDCRMTRSWLRLRTRVIVATATSDRFTTCPLNVQGHFGRPPVRTRRASPDSRARAPQSLGGQAPACAATWHPTTFARERHRPGRAVRSRRPAALLHSRHEVVGGVGDARQSLSSIGLDHVTNRRRDHRLSAARYSGSSSG